MKEWSRGIKNVDRILNSFLFYRFLKFSSKEKSNPETINYGDIFLYERYNTLEYPRLENCVTNCLGKFPRNTRSRF